MKTTEFPNIFTELLAANPLDCIGTELSPLEVIMAKIIPFKGYLNLTDSQKILIMQSIKYRANKELVERNKPK